jgi:hypothetical protein
MEQYSLCTTQDNLTQEQHQPQGAEGLTRLESLNLYANKVADTAELLRLCPLKLLTDLNLRLNPVTKQESYRLFVARFLPRLRRLDGSDITPSERSRAVCLFANLDLTSSDEGSADERARGGGGRGGRALPDSSPEEVRGLTPPRASGGGRGGGGRAQPHSSPRARAARVERESRNTLETRKAREMGSNARAQSAGQVYEDTEYYKGKRLQQLQQSQQGEAHESLLLQGMPHLPPTAYRLPPTASLIACCLFQRNRKRTCFHTSLNRL